MIARDALLSSCRILRDIRCANAMFELGHESKGRALLARIAAEAASEIPIFEAVIATQDQAAKALDRAQWTPSGFIPLRERPEPHLHIANDEHPITPEQPGGNVA